MFRLNLWTRPFLHPSAGGPGMENSPYLPNPLASPALMVLASSTAESGRDGNHLQHGHGLTHGSGEKDPASALPFAASSFPLFRPGEHLPPPLYSHLHQPFLRPHLDPHTLGLLSPRGVGAFHSMQEDRESYPSAFMPAKKAKIDELVERPGSKDGGNRTPRSTDGEMLSRRHSPYSPEERHSRHSSPALSCVDSTSDLHSEAGERNSPNDTAKDLRKWVSADGHGLCCPICKASLQPGEVQSHFAKELADLKHICDKNMAKSDTPQRPDGNEEGNKPKDEMTSPVTSLHTSIDVTSKSRYETFMRIKGNREGRLAKLRGRRKRAHEEGPVIGHDPHDVNGHMDAQEDETIDVIGYDDKENGWSETSRVSDLNTSVESVEKENVSMSSSNSPGSELNKDNSSRVKCSVCMAPYCSPVTSVQCWHVHCEKCWLQALSTKKLCPQCNIVTTSSDLRRIYI